ncbi:GNAT family N-acetyltransferase [Planococcus shenhongbingii]|uniref:GNAT family N-acetyltransferase n=1 Tax=Planococcus shenhongbingii TaxID=3058398 RepID=A0ABT8NCT6_9BACL|nr:GNAT family N-acetyltransferase [Planococcus sp. N017]MDN7245360.1 GNAT family N-acetyltransferase [Planococcus sp. N017]
MEFPILETSRLQLVQIGQQYAERFYEIMSREDVTEYYGMDKLINQQEAEAIIKSFQIAFDSKRGMRWGIVLKENGDFIGTIGLNNLNIRAKKSEIGYELHPDYWRQGFMKEAIKAVLQYAFENLDLVRMGAVTFPDNEASSRLLRKMGFTEEGRLRSYLYQGGQSHDALIFSLLKPEWVK